MTNEKTPLESDAQEAMERYGDSPPQAVNRYILTWMEQDIQWRNIQQKHALAINPKLRDIIEQTRWMRIGIVVAAAITPLIMLALLLWHVYRCWPIWHASEGGAMAMSLSAPMTALIVGTFASFILIYSALVIGIFSQSKAADSTLRKQDMKMLHGVIADAIKKATSNDS